MSILLLQLLLFMQHNSLPSTSSSCSTFPPLGLDYPFLRDMLARVSCLATNTVGLLVTRRPQPFQHHQLKKFAMVLIDPKMLFVLQTLSLFVGPTLTLGSFLGDPILTLGLLLVGPTLMVYLHIHLKHEHVEVLFNHGLLSRSTAVCSAVC